MNRNKQIISTLLNQNHIEFETIINDVLNKKFFNLVLSQDSKKLLSDNIMNLYVQFLKNSELQNYIHENNIDHKTVIYGIVEAIVYLTFEITFKNNKKKQCHIYCNGCTGGSVNVIFHCGILPDKFNKDEKIKFSLRILFNPEIDPTEYNRNFKKILENENLDEFCVKPLLTNDDLESNMTNNVKKQNDIIKTYWQVLPPLYEVEEFTDDVIYDYFDTTFNCLIMIHKAGLFYRDWKIENTMYDYRIIKDNKGKKKPKAYLLLMDIDFTNKKSDIISPIRYNGIEKFVSNLGIKGKNLEYAIDNLVCFVSFMIYYSCYAEDTEKYYIYADSLEYEKNIPSNFKTLITHLYKINSLIDSSNFTDYIIKNMRTEIINIFH